MASYRPKTRLTIVSGGQTGVDRAALDFAIEHDLAHGGWCPRDRVAEDGPISSRYNLRETGTTSYPDRTEKNVKDSDGTLIVSETTVLTRGTALTATLARRHFKPLLIVTSDTPIEENQHYLRLFVTENAIHTLNVAGPRASSSSELTPYVSCLLAVLVE